MDAGGSLEEAVAGLYAALRRPRPVLLLAQDPAEHARLTLAALRPPFSGFTLYLLVMGGGMSVLYLVLAFLPAGKPLPWYTVLLLAVTLAGFAWCTPLPARTAFRWLGLVPLIALMLAGALAGSIPGGLFGLGLGVMVVSQLWLWQGILRGLLGPVGARWRLRRHHGGLAPLGTTTLQPMVEERLRHAAEGLQPPPGAPTAALIEPTPAEREAVRRIRLLLDRLCPDLVLLTTLEPSLGRGVDDGRVGGGRLRQAAPAPGLPVLAERALALDRWVVAATLLEGCAVVLPHAAEAVPPGVPREEAPAVVLARLGAPAWLAWLAGRYPERLGLRLAAWALDREPDPALRQEGAERLGPGRVLAALGRGPVAEDGTGALFALGPEPQPTLFVRVADRVSGSEGLARLHWLPVPPHVASPKEAVAWTFGRTAAAYAPELET
jgi:hypothetical protein